MKLCAFFLFIVVGCSLPEKSHKDRCIVDRAVIEFGSNNTKVISGRIDSCKKRLLSYKSELIKKIDFLSLKKQDLYGAVSLEDSNGVTSSTIKELLKELRKKGLVPQAIIATGVFRSAKHSWVNKLTRAEFGLEVKVLSVEEELEYARRAVAYLTRESEFVVWDIGGASMQLSATTLNGQSKFFSNLGAESFSREVSQRLNRKSPNPLGTAGVSTARDIVRLELKRDLSNEQRSRFGAGALKVFGIGGVHQSVKKVLSQGKEKTSSYSLKDLQERLDFLRSQNDTDIAGSFPKSAATNLVLLQEVGRAFGFSTVEVMQVSTGLGAFDQLR